MSIQSNFPNLKPSLLLDFANTKQLDNRITFTRSTPACHYDGKTTAMAEQNLLLQSQTFSPANWIIDNVTLTGSQTAPDGTSTASLITDNSTNSDHRIYQLDFPSSEGAYTIFSVYLKNGTRQYALIRLQKASVTAGIMVDLSAGTIASSGGNGYYASSITSVGGGWYRCVIVGSGLLNGNVVVALSNTSSYGANITYVGSGQTIYAWGAQAEVRNTPSATAYTPTTTQPITNYIPVLLTAGGNQARFDCNPTTGESLGLLIEEQRTNICLYSGAIGTGNWGGLSPSIVAIPNTAVAPNGTVTATQLILASGGGGYYVTTGQTITIGQPYTLSCWMRTDTGTKTIGIGGVNGFSNGSCTVTTTWQRFTFTGTSANGFEYFGFDNRITGGSTSGFVYVWGYQVEAASFATSYIATTSASATRTADVTQMTGTNFSSWFNNAQGTFVATVSAGTVSNTGARVLKISDTDSNRLIDFYINGSTSAQAIYSYQNGITSANYPVGTISTSKYLTAVSYATGNISALINGGSVTTSTSAVVSSVANSTFSIGYDPISGANQISRPIAKIAYYPIQVTSANLQALTS
jgi:hypothetical protein